MKTKNLSHNNCVATLLLLMLFIAGGNIAPAQVTIGDIEEPQSFSTLQLESTEGGMRLPQLDLTERSRVDSKIQAPSMANAPLGLSIYNKSTGTIQYWNGSSWIHALGTTSEANEENFLQSVGSSKLPQWTMITFPNVHSEEYYSHFSDVKNDLQGALLPNLIPEEFDRHVLNEPLTSKWTVIDGLNTEVEIPGISNPPPGKDINRVSIRFQTSVQLGTGILTRDHVLLGRIGFPNQNYTEIKLPSVSYTIGIFVGSDEDGYKLKLVRVYLVEAYGKNVFPIKTATIIGTLRNLPTDKPQTIKIAVKRRSQRMDYSGEWALSDEQKTLAIGRPHPLAIGTNSFMTQSSLKVSVYVLDPKEVK